MLKLSGDGSFIRERNNVETYRIDSSATFRSFFFCFLSSDFSCCFEKSNNEDDNNKDNNNNYNNSNNSNNENNDKSNTSNSSNDNK